MWNETARYVQKRLTDEEAASEGLKIVFPEQGQLLIDLDTNEQLKQFIAMYIRYAKDHWDSWFTISKNGKIHAYIDTKSLLNDCERVALQACFGSDPIRTWFSLQRIAADIDQPTLLYERTTHRRLEIQLLFRPVSMATLYKQDPTYLAYKRSSKQREKRKLTLATETTNED